MPDAQQILASQAPCLLASSLLALMWVVRGKDSMLSPSTTAVTWIRRRLAMLASWRFGPPKELGRGTELLLAAGIHLPVPVGIDTIDAALCALTAHLVAAGAESLCYGDAESGFIIAPKARS